MDKSRQQFEYWYFNNHSHEQKYPLHKDEGGEYFYDGARKAWVAWQASRESLEIELPTKEPNPSQNNSYAFGYNRAITEATELLNRQGVRIKNENTFFKR
ncbi:hypothetical protein ABN056_08050 [Providencia vermicola]|uniref:hypothetical protein n=1 Tax=Providencia vermicola TaxID=333965 RepID=UPI0032DBB4D9